MQKQTLFPLIFLIGTLTFAVFGYTTWRNDQRLALDGLETRATVVERSIRPREVCDANDECHQEESHFLTYSFSVENKTYQKEQLVSAYVYNRAESNVRILYLPKKPNISNLAANVNSTAPLPIFAIGAVLVGVVGTAVIFRMRR